MADAGLPETPSPQPAGEAGRFTTGTIMRHVSVMTLTGSLGLTFMFLVDFVTLLYVSMLGDERLTSAVGYAWTLQFFTVAMGMGFSIAAVALGAFLPVARLRFGFCGQGGDRHRRSEGAQRASFHKLGQIHGACPLLTLGTAPPPAAFVDVAVCNTTA